MRLPTSLCRPVVVATLGALVLFACGGGGTSSSPASPTQPTTRPAAFTIAVQILQIVPFSTPTGMEATSTPPQARRANARVTVTETGGTTGGRLNELLLDMLQRSGSTASSTRYSETDIVAQGGSNRIPPGGQFTFEVSVWFTNRTGDVVNTLASRATVTADTGERATPSSTTAVSPPAMCAPTSTTACLDSGRFQAQVDWRTSTARGVGTVGPDGASGSQFWFFGPHSHELVIKALDGCQNNGRWWMFVASATNVEFTLTVTDTQTGAGRRYFNPMGLRAAHFTDMDAFATCP